MAASFTSMDSTRSSTWMGLVGLGLEGRGRTFLIAEPRFGLGVELFAPKRRFMLMAGCRFGLLVEVSPWGDRWGSMLFLPVFRLP